jgi:hypothetical protein
MSPWIQHVFCFAGFFFLKFFCYEVIVKQKKNLRASHYYWCAPCGGRCAAGAVGDAWRLVVGARIVCDAMRRHKNKSLS